MSNVLLAENEGGEEEEREGKERVKRSSCADSAFSTAYSTT